MCLEIITEKYEAPSTLIESGWKEFNNHSKPTLEFQNYGPNDSTRSRKVEFDKWLTATEVKIKSNSGDYYNTGFHIYTGEPSYSEKKYFTRVFFRKVHTKGTQNGKVVVIAQELYVPSDPEGWPPTKSEKAKKDRTLKEKIKDILPGGTA